LKETKSTILETTKKNSEKLITPPLKAETSADDVDVINQVNNIKKSLNEMLPTRQDIPTEFRLDGITDVTYGDSTSIPEGFDSGVTTSAFKWLGMSSLIELDFRILKFESEDSARKKYNKRKDFMINDGGYTELDIKVPSGAECFSFLEDYGFDASFAISYCFKDNFEYEVSITAGNTFENPKKYLKDNIILLDNKINK